MSPAWFVDAGLLVALLVGADAHHRWAVGWNLDRDFRVYRQHGSQTIPLVTPFH